MQCPFFTTVPLTRTGVLYPRVEDFYIAPWYQDFTYICNCVCCMYVPSFCSTNFGALLLYEREGWVQIDEHRYWTPGQAWFTRIGIKLLAYVSPEKIAFPCEVFLKFCLIFVYHTFCISPSFEGTTYLDHPIWPIPCDHPMWPYHVTIPCDSSHVIIPCDHPM